MVIVTAFAMRYQYLKGVERVLHAKCMRILVHGDGMVIFKYYIP